VVRAAICREYGPPEVVSIGDFPLPALVPGHVRVGVQAASVNFPDVLFVANEYQFSVPPPFVPGSELAGVVLEIADDVSTLQVGDRVFGTVTVGAFAEQIVLPATSLTPIPEGIEAPAAAAFGVAHRTAYHVLRSVAALQPGEQLVVLGAAGGVGLAAVQLGVQLGAEVTAVASSSEKLDVAAQNGATRLINHRTQDLRQALKDALPQGGDVVIDPVGGELAEPALRCLHYGGRFVTVGYASGVIPRIPLNLVLLKGMQVLGFQFIDFATHRSEELVRNEAELLQLLATGRVSPHIGARFALHDAVAALRYVADGKAIGKVLLDLQ
jgi:NADPH2:quinone reductase